MADITKTVKVGDRDVAIEATWLPESSLGGQVLQVRATCDGAVVSGNSHIAPSTIHTAESVLAGIDAFVQQKANEAAAIAHTRDIRVSIR